MGRGILYGEFPEITLKMDRKDASGKPWIGRGQKPRDYLEVEMQTESSKVS